MKLIIKNELTVTDISALKAVDVTGFDGETSVYRYVEDIEKTYSYEKNMVSELGEKPNEGSGCWLCVNGIVKEILSIESDSYDATNDIDLTSIENWHNYGILLLGSATGFMDWKCLKGEIKTLANSITNDDLGTNWNNLSVEEKKIVCIYLTSKVPGIKFAETYTDEAERLKIGLAFDGYSTQARQQRYLFMRIYLLGKIGTVSGIKYLNDCINAGRVEAFISGIESFDLDGVEALIDMILGTEGTIFDNTQTDDSLKALVNRDYPIVDGSGDTLQEVANTLVGIANGLY